MRKLIYLSIIAGLMLMSCQNSKDYTIRGEVVSEAYEGTNVYMQKMTDDAMIITDTSVVSNGKFSFSGSAEIAELRFITLDETINTEHDVRVPVLVEPGRLNVNFDTVITIGGTEVNNAYNSMRKEQQILVKQIRSVVDRYNAAQSEGTLTESLEAEVNQEYDNINKQLTELNYNFAKNGIPGIFYFNGVHADYHKATDTIEKINFDQLVQRTKLVFHTAWEVANRDQRLVVDSNKK